MIKNKKFQTFLLVLNIVFVVIGSAFVFITIDKDTNFGFKDTNFGFLKTLLIFYVFAIISTIIAVILHELGHLLAGLLSGYKFVFYRLGHISFVKYRDHGYKIKNLYMPGTLGQCIMRPPEKKNGAYPSLFYNLGGVLMNLLLAILAYMIFLRVSNDLLKFFLLVFAFINIQTLVMNLSPIIGTDGYNILEIKKSDDYKNLFWEVITLDCMSLDDEDGVEDFEFSVYPEDGSLVQYVDITHMNRALYSSDYEKFDEIYEHFTKRKDLHPFYHAQAKINKAYVDLVRSKDATVLDGLTKDKETKNIVNGLNKSLQKRRLDYAYQFFVEKDDEKLSRAKKNFEEALESDIDLHLVRKEHAELAKIIEMG